MGLLWVRVEEVAKANGLSRGRGWGYIERPPPTTWRRWRLYPTLWNLPDNNIISWLDDMGKGIGGLVQKRNLRRLMWSEVRFVSLLAKCTSNPHCFLMAFNGKSFRQKFFVFGSRTSNKMRRPLGKHIPQTNSPTYFTNGKSPLQLMVTFKHIIACDAPMIISHQRVSTL